MRVTTLPLVKCDGGNGILWETENYFIRTSNVTDSNGMVKVIGYDIVNDEHQTVEVFIDQEPAAVITIQRLQKVYDEVMPDPVKSFEDRERESRAFASQLSATGGPVIQ
jgi:hypothetical protein